MEQSRRTAVPGVGIGGPEQGLPEFQFHTKVHHDAYSSAAPAQVETHSAIHNNQPLISSMPLIMEHGSGFDSNAHWMSMQVERTSRADSSHPLRPLMPSHVEHISGLDSNQPLMSSMTSRVERILGDENARPTRPSMPSWVEHNEQVVVKLQDAPLLLPCLKGNKKIPLRRPRAHAADVQRVINKPSAPAADVQQVINKPSAPAAPLTLPAAHVRAKACVRKGLILDAANVCKQPMSCLSSFERSEIIEFYQNVYFLGPAANKIQGNAQRALLTSDLEYV